VLAVEYLKTLIRVFILAASSSIFKKGGINRESHGLVKDLPPFFRRVCLEINFVSDQ
jgi:hypothetical protein